MARMTSYEESKQYETNTGFKIFSLEDDGDTDKVQFVASSLDDMLIYTTHGIPMRSQNGRDYQRKVGCLKQHATDPKGTCPLCDSGSAVKLARFIPLYSHAQKEIVLWERSGQFIEKNIGSLLNRLKSQGKDPRNCVVEIVRCGRKGDQKTTYQFYPMDSEQPVDTSGLEIPDPEGSLIATWSAGDMNAYVANGTIPQNSTSNNANANVVRRDRAASVESYNGASRDYGNPSGFNGSPGYSAVPDFSGAQPVSDPTSMF